MKWGNKWYIIAIVLLVSEKEGNALMIDWSVLIIAEVCVRENYQCNLDKGKRLVKVIHVYLHLWPIYDSKTVREKKKCFDRHNALKTINVFKKEKLVTTFIADL